jgi:hypothetical protein
MSKARRAQIVTILTLAIALGAAVVRRMPLRASFGAIGAASDRTPQEVVYAMLDAARNGDVVKYLASHTGEIEQSLERARSESADFAQYLRTANMSIVGIAVNEPEVLSENEMQVRVEYVFRDRNEIQVLHLSKTPAGWKISRVDAAEHIETKTPYGVPIG